MAAPLTSLLGSSQLGAKSIIWWLEQGVACQAGARLAGRGMDSEACCVGLVLTVSRASQHGNRALSFWRMARGGRPGPEDEQMGDGRLDKCAAHATRNSNKVGQRAEGASSSFCSVANPKQGCPVCPVRQTIHRLAPAATHVSSVPHSSLRHDLCRSISFMRNCAPWDPATPGLVQTPGPVDDYWIRSSMQWESTHAFRY